MSNITSQLRQLEEQLQGFAPSRKHDLFGVETLKGAIAAAKSGNFGVGAILAETSTGKILCRGHNRVFSENRSDLHAEMDLLNSFEEVHKDKSRDALKGLTLYTSLESCPMCLCRIITAGLTEVYHIADDVGGGMVHIRQQLPPIWQDIAKGRVFKKADCSDVLSDMAQQVFLLTMNLNDRL